MFRGELCGYKITNYLAKFLFYSNHYTHGLEKTLLEMLEE